ncbi:MAG: hypothetical protein FWH02_06860 [Oscillospiraceae bacterium]|nr:hypothetical protein [Oscillospiraceae bacterium]
MQKITPYHLKIDIEEIEYISGPNPCFEIYFAATDKRKYKLIFDNVWDLRYSIEITSVERFIHFRENSPEWTEDNGIYLIEDSDYIKYFTEQTFGAYPTDELKHYLVHDAIDTILDILGNREPLLVRLPDEVMDD